MQDNSKPTITRDDILAKREAVDLQTAADYLGVSHKTLRRLIGEGKLPAHRVGGRAIRVLVPDVAALREPVS